MLSLAINFAGSFQRFENVRTSITQRIDISGDQIPEQSVSATVSLDAPVLDLVLEGFDLNGSTGGLYYRGELVLAGRLEDPTFNIQTNEMSFTLRNRQTEEGLFPGTTSREINEPGPRRFQHLLIVATQDTEDAKAATSPGEAYFDKITPLNISGIETGLGEVYRGQWGVRRIDTIAGNFKPGTYNVYEVNEITWPDASETQRGKRFNICFGAPGRIGEIKGIPLPTPFPVNPILVSDVPIPGMPALPVFEFFVPADPPTIPTAFTGAAFTIAALPYDETPSLDPLDYQLFTTDEQNEEPLKTTPYEMEILEDGNGLRHLILKIRDIDSPDFFPAATGGNIKMDGQYFAGTRADIRSGRLGDVIDRIFRSSTISMDWGRQLAERDKLNKYKLDFFLNEDVAPVEWFQDFISEIFPVAWMATPDGVYLKDLNESGCPVAVFTDGSDVYVDPGVSHTETDVVNDVQLSYAKNIMADTYYRERYATPNVSPLARLSADSFGVSAKKIESSHIYDTPTAVNVALSKVKLTGFKLPRFTLYMPNKDTHLRAGDLIGLELERYGLTGVRAIIESIKYDETSTITLTVLALPGGLSERD